MASLSLLLGAAFGFEDLWFNIIGVPSKHRWVDGGARTPLLLMVEYSTVAVTLLASIALAAFARHHLTPGGPSDHPAPVGPRRWLAENPWILLVLMAFAAVPTSFLSRIKWGGGWSNYAPTPYFLSLGLMALLIDWHASNRRRGLEALNSAMTLGLLLLVLSPMTRREDSFEVFNTTSFSSSNFQEAAFEYSKRHPGTAYFPWNPLSTLMAEGKLYHFEYGMFDRELAGSMVSDRHFREGIPENLRYVCFPPFYKFGRPFEWTLKFLPEFRRPVAIPELPGWNCYER